MRNDMVLSKKERFPLRQRPSGFFQTRPLAILSLATVLVMMWMPMTPTRTSPPRENLGGFKVDTTASFVRQGLPRWQEGMLDIHHMRVGPSETTFLILPDGTTMLIDAGDVDLKTKLPKLHAKGHEGLQIRPPWPYQNRSTAQWTLDYIHHFWPRPDESKESSRRLDYFLLTHFHCDHLGDPQTDSPTTENGSYKLSGTTEVLSHLPARTIVDRGHPHYDEPAPRLAEWTNVANYRKFLEHGHQGTVQAFEVKSTTQFTLQYKSSADFKIYNLKSNRQVVSEWTAGNSFQDRTIHTIPGDYWVQGPANSQKWDENEFSTAILLEYGGFHYYEGGDQERHGDYDAVTPTARAAGPVDVATANHHGRGTNAAYCDHLDPAVVILQGLFSDQPLVETMELLTTRRRRPSDDGGGTVRTLFVTDIYEERLRALGSRYADAFADWNGHVVVRVTAPGPTQQSYAVYVLDEDRKVKSQWGPFKPRKRN